MCRHGTRRRRHLRGGLTGYRAGDLRRWTVLGILTYVQYVPVPALRPPGSSSRSLRPAGRGMGSGAGGRPRAIDDRFCLLRSAHTKNPFGLSLSKPRADHRTSPLRNGSDRFLASLRNMQKGRAGMAAGCRAMGDRFVFCRKPAHQKSVRAELVEALHSLPTDPTHTQSTSHTRPALPPA